jgi:hypothetical protein
LETRNKRGFPHFHDDDGGWLLTATTTNPTKIGVSYRFLRRTGKGGVPRLQLVVPPVRVIFKMLQEVET